MNERASLLFLTKVAETLDTGEREDLKKSQFAVPEKEPESGSYPIPDEEHARNALARVAQFGTPEEKARVRAAVAEKFPNIDQGEGGEKKEEDKEGTEEKGKKKDLPAFLRKKSTEEKGRESDFPKMAGLPASLQEALGKFTGKALPGKGVQQVSPGLLAKINGLSPMTKLLLLGGGILGAKKLFGGPRESEQDAYGYGMPPNVR